MSADPEQFDRRLMREAFDLFEQHEQMREVVCQYGARAEQQLAASPRVRWEPGRETFAGPVSRRSFAIQPRGQGEQNQLSAVRSRYVRQASADLHLYGKTHRDVEELIARVVLALEDIFLTADNGRPVSGQWDLAREQSTAGEHYVLSIVLKLPVVRVQPAATAGSATTTEVPPS